MPSRRKPTSIAGDRHEDWTALVGISGPFLALPVLKRIWPTLEPIGRDEWAELRAANLERHFDPDSWTSYILHRLLGWGDALEEGELGSLRTPISEYSTTVEPDFALVDPVSGEPRLIGMKLKPGQGPTNRLIDDAWPVAPTDRVARICRVHRVPLGLVTDGRWFALVSAPVEQITTTVVFDSETWAEAADRLVVRAFKSLLERRRFFGVPDLDTLPALLKESLERQEEVTETLGDQVHQAVEMLVTAIGWHDRRARERRELGLAEIGAHDVYRASVTMIMRIVFLLFAEERGLLPAENDLYTLTYSIGHLADSLQRQVQQGTEEDLEYSCAAWFRILALCEAIHNGVSHRRLRLPTYDGPMFDPVIHPWLPSVHIDDRTVLHMLRAVQYVQLNKERRRLSFRALGVEQIGHVYERLLAYDAARANDIVVSLDSGRSAVGGVARLGDLEAHTRGATSVETMAESILAAYGEKITGKASTIARRLTPATGPALVEARRSLYHATGGDYALTERLLPFFGILRRDLRGVPTVIPTDALYVGPSGHRSRTGTHYTPPWLAAKVVEGALAELAYDPGPATTPVQSEWRVRPSAELLALRVADIAVGSGAFLVAACRYLALRLIEAWAREGNAEARRLTDEFGKAQQTADGEADPLTIRARRAIIQHCLYGVDVDPMASEVARLSLWLISMDPEKPFTFLDHRIVSGDSLLGITSLVQLEELHLDPKEGRAMRSRRLGDPGYGSRGLVRDVASARRDLAALPDDTLDTVKYKARRWKEIQEITATSELFADLIVGASLNSASRPERDLKTDLTAVADLVRRVTAKIPGAESKARQLAAQWLSADQDQRTAPRRPLHWPLVFAEVFDQGGFHAILGNQPYLGGQRITGTLGRRYREMLVKRLGGGVRGSADLVAYFVVRSHDLLAPNGVTALIATNTLWQGDSRQVGLDRLTDRGVTIRRATKSIPWPTKSATLEVCLVQTSLRAASPDVLVELDGNHVRGITPSLDPISRVHGKTHRLAENSSIAFIGSYVLGMGFTMEADRAQQLIRLDPRNSSVLFPYLNGQDLNTRPDCSASRWVINFHDWSIERAAQHKECFDQVAITVRPERAKNSRPARRDRWWQFAERAPGLYLKIADLRQVIAITRVSKAVIPAMVDARQVIGETVTVISTDDFAALALLNGAAHYWWAINKTSTLESRVRYAPSDVFETFPRPYSQFGLRELGSRLDAYRRRLMLDRQVGLTTTYNMVHDRANCDAEISELRVIHVGIDREVTRAYGWEDLDLDHDFYETRQGVRFTVGPLARQEMLDRLLQLNHERYAAEQRAATKIPRRLRMDDADPARLDPPTAS